MSHRFNEYVDDWGVTTGNIQVSKVIDYSNRILDSERQANAEFCNQIQNLISELKDHGGPFNINLVEHMIDLAEMPLTIAEIGNILTEIGVTNGFKKNIIDQLTNQAKVFIESQSNIQNGRLIVIDILKDERDESKKSKKAKVLESALISTRVNYLES